MHLKIIGENTLLSSLNGGAGISGGRFTITNAAGKTATIDLTSQSIKTVGDVLRTELERALGHGRDATARRSA
jgi:hypothetical protein